MTPSNADALLDNIFTIIAKHSDGASLSQIKNELNNLTSAHPRTIQRRLQQLISQQLIISKGSGRATKYFVSSTSTPSSSLQDLSSSKSAQRALKLISKPLTERKPVSYNAKFLNDYIPNQTYYLPADIRAELQQIGYQGNASKPGVTFANQILNRLLIDLSWNSSRLEGNTYSLLETERLINFDQAATGKDLFETRMILNHKAAIEFLVELGDDLNFNNYIILNLHALLSYNLLGNTSASGRLRNIPVSIGKTTYQPLAIPQLIAEHFSNILNKASAIKDPFEQSFFAMVHLPYLQPFVDVNKRVSRLSANIPLIKYNYCPISFVDVNKQNYIDGMLSIYELNDTSLLQDVYVSAYQRSTLRYSEAQAILTEPDLFIEQYNLSIKKLIQQVVTQKMSKIMANTTINEWAANNISKDDQQRFIEIVETELLNLHIGSLAQYKISLDEYEAWQAYWNK